MAITKHIVDGNIETTIVEGVSSYYLRKTSGAARNLEMAAEKMVSIGMSSDAKTLAPIGRKLTELFWDAVEDADE